MAASSARPIPATSSACRTASTAAGLADRSARSSRSRSRRSAWPCRNTQRSAGTPSRRAAATDISSTAAPWLTFSLATMYRVYGSAIGRFSAVGVTSSAAPRSTGAAACGLAAATRVNGANSAPIAAAYSARVSPSRARRAFSISAYWLGAPARPCAARCGDDHAAQPVAAVLQAAAGVLGEVRPVRRLARSARTVEIASAPNTSATSLPPGRDRAGQLGDQVLRALAAADLEDRPRRVGADAARPPSGGSCPSGPAAPGRCGWEISNWRTPGDGVDGRGDGGRVRRPVSASAAQVAAASAASSTGDRRR